MVVARLVMYPNKVKYTFKMNGIPSTNTQDIFFSLWPSSLSWVFLNLKVLLVLLQTWTYYEQRKLEEIIDAEVGEDLNVEEACRFLKVGLLCTQDAMKLRPNMANIVLMLTGEKEVSMDRVTKPAVIGDPYLNGNNDQRPSNADTTTLRSFATTEPLTSSEANTEWSL